MRIRSLHELTAVPRTLLTGAERRTRPQTRSVNQSHVWLLLVLPQYHRHARGRNSPELSDNDRHIVRRHCVVHEVQQRCTAGMTGSVSRRASLLLSTEAPRYISSIVMQGGRQHVCLHPVHAACTCCQPDSSDGNDRVYGDLALVGCVNLSRVQERHITRLTHITVATVAHGALQSLHADQP